jgi:hypothetical protein
MLTSKRISRMARTSLKGTVNLGATLFSDFLRMTLAKTPVDRRQSCNSNMSTVTDVMMPEITFDTHKRVKLLTMQPD